MLIQSKPVSLAVRAAVEGGLGILHTQQVLALSFAGVSPAAVQLSFEHEAYAAGLDQLARGDALPQACHHTSTRVIVSENEQPRAVAEVKDNHFLQLDRGEHLDAAWEAVARFSAQPDNQLHYDNIEFRWFRVPALHLLAVWLHQATGPHDLFIPVGTRWMPAVLHQGQVYPAEEFGALLRAPAQNRLETTKGKRA